MFVPRGVGNSYQALEDGTVYSYLVNDHWRPGINYPALHLGDPTCAIPWPIPLAEAEISEKDHANPTLDAVTPVAPKRTLIIGANGQLGRALHDQFPDADLVDLVADTRRGVAALDASDASALAAVPWRDYSVVLNAAAYTAVDAAETNDGRVAAWTANATAPALLARAADEHGFTLVHYSSEYVFDGTRELHTENEPLSPLGVYAQSKAAGDVAVGTVRRHYLLRTSWVVGEGRNFVRTMHDLANRGVSPAVVDDQVGRLTFTSELARATAHLLSTRAEFGTYNVTNGGEPMTWFDVAAEVYARSGRARDDVARTTTAAYADGKDLAPRPQYSVLDLTKLESTGFAPESAATALARYVETLSGS